MQIHDDYSETTFFTETDKKQKPILTPAEQAAAYREFWNFEFYRALMQPYNEMTNSLFDFPPKDEAIPSMETIRRWREENRKYFEELRKELNEHEN